VQAKRRKWTGYSSPAPWRRNKILVSVTNLTLITGLSLVFMIYKKFQGGGRSYKPLREERS